MNLNIVTWSSTSVNGAFQKEIGTKVFSDKLTVKPTFSFAYTDMQYIEQNNTFKVNGVEMTASQKTEVLSYINSVTPPIEWNKAVKTQEIEQAHNTFVNAVVGNVPNTEIATWQKQEAQARAWKADNAVTTPMIDGLLTGRAIAGETKLILVDKIIANADAYETAYAPVLGNYQTKMKQINDAVNAAEVDSVVW